MLHTLHENGITVNLKKCLFDVEELGFAGLIFNKDGIKPDPKHLQNLREASPPQTKVELGSLWVWSVLATGLSPTKMENRDSRIVIDPNSCLFYMKS